MTFARQECAVRELKISDNPLMRGRGGNFESFILAPVNGTRRYLFKPTWDFTALVFRPLPIVDENDQITSLELDGDIGNWFGSGFDVAEVAGERFANFVVRHRLEDFSVREDSPAWALHTFFSKYSKVKMLYALGKTEEAEHKKALLDPKIYKRLEIDTRTSVKVKQMTAIQSLVLVHKSKLYEPMCGLEPHLPAVPIVLLPSSASQEVESNIKETGGHIVDVTGEEGAFIRVVRHGTDKSWYPTSGKPGLTQYEVRVLSKYDQHLPNLPKDFDITSKTTKWSKTFILLSPEEQLNIILWCNIPSIYLYCALADSFDLPNRVIKEATKELGITSVPIDSTIPVSEKVARVEEQRTPQVKQEVKDDLDSVTFTQKAVVQEQPKKESGKSLLNKISNQLLEDDDEDEVPFEAEDINSKKDIVEEEDEDIESLIKAIRAKRNKGQ